MAHHRAKDYVLVGQIGPARGLKGEVLVRPFTDFSEQRFAPGSVLFDQSDRPFEVLSYRLIKNRHCLIFKGHQTREAAEAIRGVQLYGLQIETSEDPELYHLDQLVGMKVFSQFSTQVTEQKQLGKAQTQAEKLQLLGTVSAVELGDYQDRLIVETSAAQVQVPLVFPIVQQIDSEAEAIILDPPAGLFD